MKYDPILYEADKRAFLEQECDFYKKIVSLYKPSRILELGVGTGRIFSKLLPLVDYAVGVDISSEMLDVCKKKCQPHTNFRLCNNDFSNFNLHEDFDLVYIPFNTFHHLLTRDEQLKCLRCVSKHMNKKSKFILDLVNWENIIFELDRWKVDYTTKTDAGEKVKREQKTLRIDSENKIAYKIFRYTVGNVNEPAKVYEFEAIMRFNTINDIGNLLNEVGLEVESVWSDYLFNFDKKDKKLIYCVTKL